MKKIYFLIGLLLMPMMAFAGPFDPSTSDISVKVINQIFGSLVNGGNDAFGDAISTFNGAVLIIGGILATYTILAGTIGTAHDGEMLGKKFSSVWIPIRYTLGTAGVLPVIGKGYCLFQLGVMWLVLQGIGLADLVWDSYMQTPGVAANMTFTTIAEDKAKELANNVFMAQLCVAENAQFIADSSAADNADSVLKLSDKYKYGMTQSNANYYFGDTKVSMDSSSGSCGYVKFADPVENSTVAAGPKSTNPGYLGPLDDLFAPTDIQPINDAHKKATQALVKNMGALAETVQKLDPDVDRKTIQATYSASINAAATTYLTTVQNAANQVAMTPSASSAKAHEFGWFLAGAYFINTVVTNNKITNAMNAIPNSNYSIHSFGELGDSVSSKLGAIWGAVKDIYAEANDIGAGGVFMNYIISGATKINLYELKNDTRHPIIIINEMGARLQMLWIGIITLIIGLVFGPSLLSAIPGVGTVASVIGSAISKIPVIGKVASIDPQKILVVLSVLSLPILALAATSFTAKYLIPMLPFMMWLGILGGWLIAVVIAVLAAPLWAVMHLHPNGDDMTGRGGNGYMLVLGLLLRPVLAIFGFIAAITISSVMGEFINKVFFQVFSFSQGDGNGMSFFIGMIAGAGIYVAIMFSFIKKCFSLMHVVPDELMKWIGGGGDQLGHYAGKMGEGSTGGFSQMAAFTAGRGIGQNMQNTNRQLKDIDKSKIQEQNIAQKEAFENTKDFEGMKESLAKKVGSDNVDAVMNTMGINEGNISSQSSLKKLSEFKGGLALAKTHGGEEGVKQFMNEFQSGHANGPMPEGAMKSIGEKIASQSVLKDTASKFGGNAQEYVLAMAGTDNNKNLDFSKAESAMNDLSVAQQVLGSDFVPVLNTALRNSENQGISPKAELDSQVQKAMQEVHQEPPRVENNTGDSRI